MIENKNKNMVIFLIISFVIGVVVGGLLFSKIDLKKTNDFSEINVLNQEINHCIDQLNKCESLLEDEVREHAFENEQED